MKKYVLLLILFLFTENRFLAAQEKVVLPEKSKFKIVLLAGQSNMAGRGFIQSEDKIPHPRVLMMNKDGDWLPSIEPTHFDKKSAGTCLGRTFAILLAESDPTITVGIVPTACGGSSIENWKSGQYFRPTNSYPYDDAIARTKKALQSGTLAAILWHQGESDCNEKRSSRYHDQLLHLFQLFRKEFQALDVPILIGGLFPRNTPYYKIVSDAQKRVADECFPAIYVEASGLTLNPDGIHFDRKSLIQFGTEYFHQYELIKRRMTKDK